MNTDKEDKKQSAFQRQLEKERQERESVSPAPELLEVFRNVGNAIAGLLWQYPGSICIDKTQSRLFEGPINSETPFGRFGFTNRPERGQYADVVIVWSFNDCVPAIEKDFVKEWLERNNLFIQGVIVGTMKITILTQYGMPKKGD